MVKGVGGYPVWHAVSIRVVFVKPAQLRVLARLRQRLSVLYGKDQGEALLSRLDEVLEGRVEPSEQLGPRWSERDTVLITYADIVRGRKRSPLRVLGEFIHQRLPGAIGAVHLLPFYPSSSDGGFSVINYREVDPEFGDWEAVEALRREAGVDLMFDLVLNHCSRESHYFRDFLRGKGQGKDYILSGDEDGDWSQVIRPRVTPLFHEVETEMGLKSVWTTFSADQVDLDWKNPEVLFEFIEIIFGYIERGASIVRLDAVAFLWKEEGHSCVHHPKTHEMVKFFRDLVSLVAPGVTLLTETNVAHHENVSYFGLSDEAHMVYQFTLPPLLLYSLLRGESGRLQEWVNSLSNTPPGCTYLNFTASHDGIGLRGLEGWVEGEDLEWLVKEAEKRGSLLGKRTLEGGKVAVYELNVTYRQVLGVEGDAEMGARRFICSQAVMLSLQGVPAVYFHSLVGSGNWEDGPRLEGGENRDINREKLMVRELERELDDPDSERSWILAVYTTMLRVRRRTRAFSPEVGQRVLACPEGLFLLVREPEDGPAVLCCFNFREEPAAVPREVVEEIFGDAARVVNLLAREDELVPSDGVKLRAYGCAWLMSA